MKFSNICHNLSSVKFSYFLCRKLVATGEEVKKTVTYLINRLAPNFYDEGIINLVQHLDKQLNHNGDYGEK